MRGLIAFGKLLQFDELAERRFVQHILLDAIIDYRNTTQIVHNGRVSN